jgi:hypothetical protein
VVSKLIIYIVQQKDMKKKLNSLVDKTLKAVEIFNEIVGEEENDKIACAGCSEIMPTGILAMHEMYCPLALRKKIQENNKKFGEILEEIVKLLEN